MTFLSNQMLLLLWLIPLLVILYVFAYKKRKHALQILSNFKKQTALLNLSDPKKRFLKATLLLTAFACIVLALARPSWGKKTEEITEQQGRDIIFMLDVSRSMLATDIKPNRLERAKLSIKDVLATCHGDRVALVVFAGDNALLCPLTLDYGFFKIMLDDAGPHSVGRGGTLIGDALRMTLNDVIDKQDTKYKDIILITDGEDHESFPVEAAAEAGKRGIRLITMGLGNDIEGERVPVSENQHSFIKYNNQEVWSKLDPNTLREMANATPNGRYLHVATGAIDLGQVYRELSAAAEKTSTGKEKIVTNEEHFQLFIILAAVLLLSEILISDTVRI